METTSWPWASSGALSCTGRWAHKLLMAACVYVCFPSCHILPHLQDSFRGKKRWWLRMSMHHQVSIICFLKHRSDFRFPQIRSRPLLYVILTVFVTSIWTVMFSSDFCHHWNETDVTFPHWRGRDPVRSHDASRLDEGDVAGWWEKSSNLSLA